MEDNEQILEEVYGVARDYPCVHGHFDCAEFEGGPCANETYARKLAEAEARAEERRDEIEAEFYGL